MLVTDNALNAMAAKALPGIGNAWVAKHLKGNEVSERVVTLLRNSGNGKTEVTLTEFESTKKKLRSSIQCLSRLADGVIGIGDRDFPPLRGDVKASEQPVALFYRGDVGLLRRESKNVAVIGLLNPDEGTRIEEVQLVNALVACGATIVSGLAKGCDTIAHEAAICAGGKTVAILPSSLNDVLPAANRGLADRIVKGGGLLLTEYMEPAGSKMELSGRYRERDRLQALFSDCVVLAASYAKNSLGNDSGARLAMEFARSYRIRRAVMYDSLVHFSDAKYELNRQLIAARDGVVVVDRTDVDFVSSTLLRCQPKSDLETRTQADLFG